MTERSCVLCLRSNRTTFENKPINSLRKSTVVSLLFPKLFAHLYKSKNPIEEFITCWDCQERLNVLEEFIETCCDCDEDNIEESHLINCRLCHRQFFSCERRIPLDNPDIFTLVINIRKKLNSDPVTSEDICKKCSEICDEMYEFQQRCLEKLQSQLIHDTSSSDMSSENLNDDDIYTNPSPSKGTDDKMMFKNEAEKDPSQMNENTDSNCQIEIKQETESVIERLKDETNQFYSALEETKKVEIVSTKAFRPMKRKKKNANYIPIKRHITAESDFEQNLICGPNLQYPEEVGVHKKQPQVAPTNIEVEVDISIVKIENEISDTPGYVEECFNEDLQENISSSPVENITNLLVEDGSTLTNENDDSHIADSDINMGFTENNSVENITEISPLKDCQVVVEKLPEKVLHTLKTDETIANDKSQYTNHKLPLKKRVSFGIKIKIQDDEQKGPATRSRSSLNSNNETKIRENEQQESSSLKVKQKGESPKEKQGEFLREKPGESPKEKQLKKEKIFQCRSCTFVTKNRYSLKVHVLYSHIDGSRYKCSYCDFVTKTERSLSAHAKEKHELKFDAVQNKNETTKSDENNEIIEPNEPTNDDSFKPNDPTNDNSFECSFCAFKSSQEFDFIEHMAYEHRKKNEIFKCKQCSFETTRKTMYKRHINVHNESAKSLNCDKCSFSAKSDELLLLHQKSVHKKPMKKNCEDNNNERNSKDHKKVLEGINDELETNMEENNSKRNKNIEENGNEDEYKHKKKIQVKHNVCEQNVVENAIMKKESSDTAINKDSSSETLENSEKNAQTNDEIEQDKKPHSCIFCNFRTTTKHLLKAHSDRMHFITEKTFKCNQCSYTGKFLQDLRTHKKFKHPKTKLLDCHFCAYKADNHKKLTVHEETKHPDKKLRYRCSECDYQSRHIKSLTIHVQCKHNSEASIYNCDKCDYTTNRKNLYEQHLTVKHDMNSKMFSCDECNFITRYEYNLYMHINHKHSDNIEELQCVLCAYKTTYKQSMKLHMRNIHSENVEWFECEQCDYKTKQKKYLKHHMIAKHSGKGERKEYKCFHCSHRTYNKYNLNRHMKVMHLEPSRIFTCEFCEYKCTWKVSLDRHVRVKHELAGETYECDTCAYSTKRYDCIKLHLKNKHGNKTVEGGEGYTKVTSGESI